MVQTAWLVVLIGFFSPALWANNGMYLIGYGAESGLMGGADVAVSRDAFASNNNPAGMTQLTGQSFELEIAPFYGGEVRHTDSFGNYRKPNANAVGGFGNVAYAQRVGSTPFAVGTALVVQGGLGWTYHGMNTNPAIGGGRDDVSSLFTIIKLAPAVAWEATDRLSLGGALGITYISATQEVFPNSSAGPSATLPLGFSGIRFKDNGGIGISAKLGLQYHLTENITIGATYGTQTSVPLKNGNLRINLGGGLGVVRYDNAKLEGLRLPEELALGIAFRPTSRLLVSLQEKWYNWSEALNKTTLTATNPRAAGAPASIVIPGALDFFDQHVVALGIVYDYSNDTSFMAGINHGSRAIPDRNVTPIFAAIHARHYTAGVRRKLDSEWCFTGGIELQPMQDVTYDSPLFGPRANERNLGYIFHFVLSRAW